MKVKELKQIIQEAVHKALQEAPGLTVGSKHDVQLADKIEHEMLQILHRFKKDERGWMLPDELVHAFTDLNGKNVLGTPALLKIAQKTLGLAGLHRDDPSMFEGKKK
jgi:hypothetical protein